MQECRINRKKRINRIQIKRKIKRIERKIIKRKSKRIVKTINRS